MRDGREYRLEAGDRFAGLLHVERPEFPPVEVGDPARSVGQTVDAFVVKDHEFSRTRWQRRASTPL